MDERLDMTIVHYASIILERLDVDAKHFNVRRPQLVDVFMDTLQALEQNREQED